VVAGVAAQQVMQAVPAVADLGQQPLGVQAIQQPAGLLRAGGGQRPRRVPGEDPGQQRDRQRQEPGQGRHLRHLARAGGGAGSQAGEHVRRLPRWQGSQQQRRGRAGQVAQVPAAGHQHQPPPAAGQQRGHLAAAGGVVQHQQRPLPGHLVDQQDSSGAE
jgi:hypothetical protein